MKAILKIKQSYRPGEAVAGEQSPLTPLAAILSVPQLVLELHRVVLVCLFPPPFFLSFFALHTFNSA